MNTKGKQSAPPTAGLMKWFNRHPLRPIDTEDENDRALEILSELMSIGQEKLKKDEIEYFRVLSSLIQEFEDRTYDLGPNLSPIEMLTQLMEENDLSQKDLVSEMGSQAAVSYVLNGRRSLTVEQIAALAKRFHVSPAVFITVEKESVLVARKSTAKGPGSGRIQSSMGRRKK